VRPHDRATKMTKTRKRRRIGFIQDILDHSLLVNNTDPKSGP
jgi:hypothetical protein